MAENTSSFNVFPVFFQGKKGGFRGTRDGEMESAGTGSGAEAGQ